MRVTANQYREEVYRLRAHPTSELPPEFVDQRDSFLGLYFTLIPFLALEYVSELSFARVPSGAMFPLGYLLFWAFYYTYYKPGFLEEKLSAPKRWDALALPAILIGVVVWFLKVTVVEIFHLLVTQWWVKKPAAHSPFHANPNHAHARGPRPAYAHRPGPQSYEFRSQRPPTRPAPSAAGTVHALPADVRSALNILGLTDRADWSEIHKRYRELAKQYHPDLNSDITSAGKRFMIYDGAYRKLVTVKDKYFVEKK